MATENVWFKLGPQVDLTTGDGKDAWQYALKTISDQPGNKAIFWGHGVEDPSLLQLVIEWESLQAHKDFMDDPEYGTFIEKGVKPFLGGELTMFHIPFPSLDTKPLQAPVTEVITQYFEPSYPNADYEERFAKFASEGEKATKDGQGIIGGWGLEELKHKLGNEAGEEQPAKAFCAFIGWPSVEAHMAFRNSEAFPKVVQHIRGPAKATEVHHVKFQKY